MRDARRENIVLFAKVSVASTSLSRGIMASVVAFFPGWRKEWGGWKNPSLFHVIVALCVIFVCNAPMSKAAFFYVHEAQEKCFLENVPTGVAVTATYENTENPGVSCSLIFKDPNGRHVYTKEVLPQDGKGKVTYLSKAHGEHKVCIYCPSSRWFSTLVLKWTISIEIGDTDMNLDDVAKKEHISGVETRLMALMSRVNAILAENSYEKDQEDSFERTSQAINSRVLWLAVTRILLVCCTTLFTVFHLTRFFQSQKLL